MPKLYSYTDAAALVDGLNSRGAVGVRITRLAKRGEPLTVEAGELQKVGAYFRLTEKGLKRLREYVAGPIWPESRRKKAVTASNVKP